MKRIIMIIMCVSVFSSYCNFTYAEEKADGYYWESLNENIKSIFMSGYLSGYNTGNAFGVTNGASWLYDYFFGDFVDKEIANKSKNCSNIIKASGDYIKAFPGAYFVSAIKKDNFKEPVEYYVRELDSFYKTYPLCRRNNLNETLFTISQVWVKSGKLSYKDLGESCLKTSKSDE
ncbi:MAG: hypothetical protein ACLPP9_00485 [Smithella sp.]